MWVRPDCFPLYLNQNNGSRVDGMQKQICESSCLLLSLMLKRFATCKTTTCSSLSYVLENNLIFSCIYVVYWSVYLTIYLSIYRERERGREIETETERGREKCSKTLTIGERRWKVHRSLLYSYNFCGGLNFFQKKKK